MRNHPTDSPGWVIPPDFITGKVGETLRADPVLAAELFDPSNPIARAAIEAYRRQLSVDDDILAEQMRYAYQTEQRDWLQRQALFDPLQFMRVADRLGVTVLRPRRGHRPMTKDEQFTQRRSVVAAVRRVWDEYPQMSLPAALLRIEHGHLNPKTVRDWLNRIG